MTMVPTRMTEKAHCPSSGEIEKFIGKTAYNRWLSLASFIEDNYPQVFDPDWIYGGSKYGWGLRYKKSKSFCTFIPESGRFCLQIVFGADEREKMKGLMRELSEFTQKAYEEAPAFHDGKWLFLDVSSKGIIDDITKMLSIKRKRKEK